MISQMKMSNTKISLFIPCFVDQFFPKIAQNTVKILTKFGFDIYINPNQTCCGQPAFNAGYRKEAYKLAKKFLIDFSNSQLIISPVASCIGFIKRHYAKILKNTAELEIFNSLKSKMFELTDFLVNYLNVSDLGAYFPYVITYHDSCTALREYGIKKEPRILLRNVKGLRLMEMKEAETCCGFGGTFSVKMPHISTSIVEKKVKSALETEADFIVSTEASCLMNIKGFIEKNKLPIKAIHISEILANF